MVIKETIEIKLQLLTDKFNNQMNKSKASMSALNKTLLKQRERLGIVNSKIKQASTSISDHKNLNKKLNEEQRKFISQQKDLIAGYKVEKTSISNSMTATRQSQAVLNNTMKDRSRIFRKKQTDMRASIKGSQQEAITTKLSAMQNLNWGGIMKLNLGDYQMLAKSQLKIHSTSGKFAMGIRNMTHGMKGFRMEMLGVMFFGMSLTRIMSGLFSKSMEWTGVMGILGTALGILFLPIAMQLLDWALLFLDWVDGLSEKNKKLIGTIVLVVGIFGLFLTIIGTLALGLGSIILVFGKLFGVQAPLAAFGKFIGKIFAGISAPILLVIAIIVAVVVGMVIAWKENFLGMKQTVEWFISGVKDFFLGLIEIIKGVLLIIKGIFTGDWKTILEGMKIAWLGFGRAIWGIIKMIVNGIMAIFTGITRILWSILKLAAAPFIWFYNFLVGHSLIPDLVKTIVDWFLWLPRKIWGAVKGIGSMVADAFTGMIPDWMLKIFKGGVSFLGKAVKGIGSIFGFAAGGVVPGPKGAPMPAIVHGGERIIPNGASVGGGSSPNITINANISNDYDVRRLADKLKEFWVNDFEKTSQGRSI